MLRGRSFFPDDNTKPALVDWRPFIFVTILVIGKNEFQAERIYISRIITFPLQCLLLALLS